LRRWTDSAIIIRRPEDPELPAAKGPAPSLRETIYGVASSTDLDAIEDELSRDRVVRRDANGTLHTVDDLGFAIAFQVSWRRRFDAPADLTNAPGSAPQRPINQLGITPEMAALPRTLSHVVYFVPDAAKGEAFYRDRLGFVTTDRFVGVGPFMRAKGMDDHHCLFMIQTPPHMQGCEHFTFIWAVAQKSFSRVPVFSRRVGRVSGAPGVTSTAPIGSGISTAHWVVTSNTTLTWISTMTLGLLARRPCLRTTRSCSCLPLARSGLRVAHRRSRAKRWIVA